METAKCPQCGRTLKLKKNPFDDPIFPRHMMGVISEGYRSVYRDYGPGHDPDRAAINETTCPMSGQVVE